MSEIRTIEDIVSLAKQGCSEWKSFGSVDVKEKDSLLLFNYTNNARRWNFFEQVSRGLIINRVSGEIVARPFDKFFNWGQNGQTTDSPILSVTEKMDGSLGILYRQNGYKIATRGSFTGKAVIVATKLLNENYNLDSISDEWTLLFEIISPENRIMIDYGSTRALVLLAIRNRFTGDYLSLHRVKEIANTCRFPVPKVFSFSTVSEMTELQKSLDGNQEGWVAEFADGQRFKFKGDRYCELHKIAAGVSLKKTAEAFISGTVDKFRMTIPDEFLEEFEGYLDQVKSTVLKTVQETEKAFAAAPKSETRKDFALWVQNNHEHLAPYLFAMLDGKEVETVICRNIFMR